MDKKSISGGNTQTNKKSKKMIISILAGAIVFIGIAGIVTAKVLMPVALPKVFVADAIKTTQKTLLQEKKLRDDLTGTALALQILQGEGMQTDFDLRFKGLTGEGTEYINGIIRGIGISGQTKRDQDGQKLLMNFAVNQNTLRMAGAEFYRNNAEVGVAVPELFDKYMAVNLDTFVEDYNHSALFDLIGEPMDQETYDGLRDYYETYSSQKINNEFFKEITQAVNARSEALFMQAEVAYIDKVNADGDTGKSEYSIYEVILKQQDVKSYIKDLYDIVTEDQAFLDYIETVDNMHRAIDGQSMSNTIEEAKVKFNDEIENVTFDDLKITLSIDNKKHIVASSYAAIIRRGEESIDAKVDVALTGKKFITDAMTFKINVKQGEEQAAVVIESTSNYGEKIGELAHHIAIEIEENKGVFTYIDFDMNYDTKSKEDNLAINANIKAENQEVFSVILEGTLGNDKSNKKIEYDMSNIAIKMNDGYINHGITFAGKYSLSAIKTSDIKFREDNKQYVFAMTQKELMLFEQTVASKIEQLSSALFQ